MMGDATDVTYAPQYDLTIKYIKQYVGEIKELMEQQPMDTLQIDLTNCKSVDSTGITFLVGVYKTMKEKNAQVALTGVSESMLQLLQMMKLDEIFRISN